MEAKSKFKRSFMLFENEDSGYELGQKPKGYIKIEERDGKGKLWLSAQYLKESADKYAYELNLLKTTGVRLSVAAMGKLVPGNNGHSLETSFDAINVAGSGVRLQDFDTAVILVRYLDRETSKVICPLAAYKNARTEWRDRLSATIRPAVKMPENKPGVNTGANRAIQYQKIESKYVPQESIPLFNIHEASMQKFAERLEKPEAERPEAEESEVEQPEFEELDVREPQAEEFNVVEPEAEEREAEEREAEEPDVEEPEAEQPETEEHEVEQSEANTLAGNNVWPFAISDEKENNRVENEGISDYNSGVECDNVRGLDGSMECDNTRGYGDNKVNPDDNREYEEAQSNNGNENTNSIAGEDTRQQEEPLYNQVNTSCVYMNGNMCGAYMKEGGTNPCSGCSAYSNPTAQLRKEEGAGNINKLKELLEANFERCDPFNSNRSDYTWWKVANPVNLNNMLYECGIRSPLLFNPSVMMSHYKYRHLIIGIFNDRQTQNDYLVCGVPGMHMVDKRPFDDMCRWVQYEGGKPLYGAFGYWLVYIDPKTGRLINAR